jgi:hypothetical protein
MTINVLGNRSGVADPHEPLAIGEEERDIFNCPECARPLAVGTSRCPSCRTRLVLDVRMQKAGLFTGLGLIVGLVVGAGAGAGAMLATAAPATGVVPNVVHPAQPANPSTGGSGVLPTAAPSVAPIAISALRQSASVNGRLADDAAELRSLAAEPTTDAPRIAQALRNLAAEAVFGLNVVTRLDGWDRAEPVAGDLKSLYGDIRLTAREGLSASLHNGPAYHAAAAEMLLVLAGLTDVDATSRDLAQTVGVELPDVFPTEEPPVP